MTAQATETSGRSSVLADRVRGAMAERRVTASVLARTLGISEAAFSRRARGELEFGVSQVEAIAHILDEDEAYLYGFTDARRPRRTEVDEALDELRARRDSNPKPSDLYPDGGRVIDLAAYRANRTRDLRHTAAVPA